MNLKKYKSILFHRALFIGQPESRILGYSCGFTLNDGKHATKV